MCGIEDMLTLVKESGRCALKDNKRTNNKAEVLSTRAILSCWDYIVNELRALTAGSR